LVKIVAFQRWVDGTLDDIHVETLQPPEWLASHQVKEGAMVPLPLDLVEMGMPEDLQGEVLAIEPCPPIKAGPGRVVLTTVNHLNAYVLELTVENSQGHRDTIRPTGFHRFYRASDEQWVSAEDLKGEDVLQGQQGLLRVVGNTRVPGVHRVYNMTVEGQHVYRVSSFGALAHNTCPPDSSSPGHKIPNSELKGPPPKRGNAPIGSDAHPVELHHRNQTPTSPLDEMTRTAHRGKGNFGKNHTNTGQEPSLIDRKAWKNQQREYWEQEWDSGRFDNFGK
jgi:hypothetical protein